ncbi:MAG TPA: hypothetical protein V6C86_26395 [Oculatellaceae cyanobacterium]
MQGDSTISKLILSGCDFNDESLKLIANIPELHELGIGRNQKITTAGLKSLTKLKWVSELQLFGTNISPKAIDVICEFGHLKKVTVNDKLWTNNDAKLLQQRLGKAGLVIRKSSKNEDVNKHHVGEM